MTASRSRLDEQALRKPGFRDGRRVRLADGQEWTFPRPCLRFRPTRDDDGEFGLGGGWEHDGAYGEIRDKLLEVGEDDTFGLLTLGCRICCTLLLANYDLADDDLGDLLVIDFDDAENAQMWRDLQPVIYADPKGPIPSGSAPP